ncbi:MAG TPA: hypothetical protein VMV18_05105 [bacterium]|nr:hypothetical protein [bacterium]
MGRNRNGKSGWVIALVAALALVAASALARGARSEAGCNSYGCWAEGGGCNSYGCWKNDGGCNSYGCWNSPRGACNSYGCSDAGECTSDGCPRGNAVRERHHHDDDVRVEERDGGRTVCREDGLVVQLSTAGCNGYGCWAEGGGCNSYGCWKNAGGCNSYGCWNTAHGACNSYGCSDVGVCNSYGCPKGRTPTLRCTRE